MSSGSENHRTLFSRLASIHRDAALLILNTLILGALIELIAMAYEALSRGAGGRAQTIAADRHEATVMRYRPLVGWRSKEFHGQAINVDSEGRRLTPGADCRPDSYRIFVLGGSAVFGTGSTDAGTIPAHLQASLAPELDRPLCTVNYGDSGWVQYQELAQLILRLQAGDRPDLVLFYDGGNDIFSAYQNGRTDLHQNFEQLRSRIESRPSFVEWANSWVSVELAKRAALRASGTKPTTYRTLGIDPETLSTELVDRYRSNMRIIGALAGEFGFKTLYFWQPLLVSTKKALTPSERALLDETDPALTELEALTTRKILVAEGDREPVHDLTHALDDLSETVFLDFFHIIPDGNRVVVEKMLPFVRAKMNALQ